jgi:excisionase family DNA binding protein
MDINPVSEHFQHESGTILEKVFRYSYTAGMVQLPEADWLTVKDSAELLGVSARRVSALIKSGRLKATRIGERVLMLRRDEVVAFSKIDRPTGRPPKEKPARKPAKSKGKK